PTGLSSHKPDRRITTAEDRYLMAVIATASKPRFSVSRVDIDRPGPTYTVDTLRDTHKIHGPGTEMFFITGADALEKMLTWHDTDELFGLAHFVGVTRPGHRLADPGLPNGRVSLMEVPALSISSPECRERVHAGEAISYLVPDGIVQYINKRDLYRDAPGECPPVVPAAYPGRGMTAAPSRSGTTTGGPSAAAREKVLAETTPTGRIASAS